MNDKLDPFRGDDDGEGRPKYSGGVLSFSFTKTFASFKNRVYRLYYLSMVGHWSSMNMQMLARTLLVYRINPSGAILGVLALANAIPTIIFTLPGGVMADRFQKKTIIQACQIISIIISAATAVVLFTGYLSPEHPESWWVLVVSGALQGAVMGFMMPSRVAIVSEIVEPDNLMNAISLNNLGMNVFRVLSPALAGFLVDAVGFAWVYAIMTFMIVTSWFFILFVPPSPARNTPGSSSLAEIGNGWRYIRGEKTIFIVLIFTVAAIILGSPYSQLLPMFTEDILKVSATDMGILMAVSGVGAIIGSLVMASLTNRRRGTILLTAGLVLGIALIGFSFSSYWYLSLVLIVFIGLGSTVQMTLGNSLIQYYTDAAHRGRVMSFLLLGFGFGSLGSFFAGLLAEGIGAPLSVGSLAILLVIMSVALMAFSKRMRKLD
jgi:MFS family permease